MLSKLRQLYAWVDEIYHRANEINLNTYIHHELSRTQLAATLLDKLIKPGQYFPVTSPTLNLFSMLQVVNEAVVNQRTCYVEFGAGLSTLIMARLKQLNQLDIVLVSVESDKNWSAFIEHYLKEEGLGHLVMQVYAPLETSSMAYKNPVPWYAEAPLKKILAEVPKPDLILVDGPSAYSQELKYSRFPAYPFLQPNLGESWCLFLDDVNRDSEWEILQNWGTAAGISPQRLSGTLGVMNKNPKFNAFYEA